VSNVTIGQKIRLIREAENLGRTRFSKLIECNERSLVNTELNALSCNSKILEAICKQFPQYTLWLMTGKTDYKVDQIEPAKNI